ncbi:MAG: diguanylate cyclase [Pseudomonadota bacterium]
MLCFFCLLYLQTVTGAERVQLSDLMHNQSIEAELEIFEDPTHLVTLEELTQTSPPYSFEPVLNTELQLSNSRSHFWLRLRVHNPNLNAFEWYLTYGDTTSDYLKIFVVEMNDEISMTAVIDDSQPFAQRPVNYRKPTVLVNTPANTTQWVYLLKRADNVGSVNPALFRLWSSDNFHQYHANEYLLLGLAMGVIAAMLLYNLFLMFATRDSAYTYYVSYLTAVLLSWLTYLGLLNQYSFTDSQFIPDVGTAFFGTFVQMASWRFTQVFLQTHRYAPRLHYLLWVLIGLSVLLLLLMLTIRGTAILFLLLGVCSAILPFIGFIVWRRGFIPARFFVIAWTIYCFSSAYFQFTSILQGTASEALLFAFLGSHILEALLLSFALADRINLMRREKEEIERQYREELNRAKSELEHQVEVRTQELLNAKESAETLASTDMLTQLNNRRAFFERAEPVLKLAARHTQPLSLIFTDIDHFKRINDTYGHAAGDEILKTVADTLRNTARETDIAGRIGGEEFVLLLPNTPQADAAQLAERLRLAIAELDVSYQAQPLSLTASFGVAALMPDNTLENLLSRADAALYEAKSSGRNRVVQVEK